MPNDGGKPPFAQTTLGTLALGITIGLVVWYVTQHLPSAQERTSTTLAATSQPTSPVAPSELALTPHENVIASPKLRNREQRAASTVADSDTTSNVASTEVEGMTTLRSIAADEAGFHFVLESCSLSGSELLCVLTVTNTRDRAKFTLYRWRVVDAAGTQTRSDLGFFGEANRRGDELPVEVPIQAHLRFENVAEGVTAFRYLELSFFYARLDAGEYEGSGTVVFKPHTS